MLFNRFIRNMINGQRMKGSQVKIILKYKYIDKENMFHT